MVLSVFVNVYVSSRSNPKSTAGRGKLSWGLVQNQCRNYFLVLEKKACFEIVLILQLFPPLITVDLKKGRLLQVLEKLSKTY